MTSQEALLWTSEQPQQLHPSECYEAGVTGTFVCGWETFFTETAFFAEAFLRTGPFGVLFFAVAAAAAAALLATFFAALLDLAQRAFCAAEILARAAALKVCTGLLLRRLALAEARGFGFPALVPARSARACCSREISASISITMLPLSMNPPLLRITHVLNPRSARMIGEGT
jgi:hypothetical protein